MDALSNLLNNFFSISWWRGIFERMGRYLGYGLALLIGLPLVLQFGYNQFAGRNAQSSNAVTKDTVLATVNGDQITQGEFTGITRSIPQMPSGEEFASIQGRILDALVSRKVIEQEARREGVHAASADVDKAIDAERKQKLGDKASERDFEDYVTNNLGVSIADFRESIANSLLYPALINKYKADERIAPEEAKNLSAEEKLAVMFTPINPNPAITPEVRRLADTVVKKKVEALLAEVKAGKDFMGLLRANSADPNAKHTDKAPYQPEYPGVPGLTPLPGASDYGKEFAKSVQKTPVGGYTDVVKATSGFTPGYAFAKVLDRRNIPPKGFDSRKAVDFLKQQRAQDTVEKLLKGQIRTAKVTIQDLDKKAFYDYFKLQSKVNQADPDEVVTPDEIARLKALVSDEFDKMLKRHPDDAVVATILAKDLTPKLDSLATPPAERDAIRDRLISLYNIILKTTESADVRLSLADLYLKRKEYKQVQDQYDTEARLTYNGEGDDSASLQEAVRMHSQLQTRYKLLSNESKTADPTLSAAAQTAADKEKSRFNDDMTKMIEANKKEAAAAKASQPSGLPGNLKLPPGMRLVKPDGAQAPIKLAPPGQAAPGGAAPNAGKP